jgi:hypothetical protein
MNFQFYVELILSIQHTSIIEWNYAGPLTDLQICSTQEFHAIPVKKNKISSHQRVNVEKIVLLVKWILDLKLYILHLNGVTYIKMIFFYYKPLIVIDQKRKSYLRRSIYIMAIEPSFHL